jgi:hypothetical protein
MSDCLHCEINQLVQERFERGDTDLVEMASLMVESLADLILLAPESDRSNLMAHALSAFAADRPGKGWRNRQQLQRHTLRARTAATRNSKRLIILAMGHACFGTGLAEPGPFL